MSEVKFDRSRTAWISRGFETLAAGKADDPRSFDVLIVGSGYGGAIAAELPRHIRFGRKNEGRWILRTQSGRHPETIDDLAR